MGDRYVNDARTTDATQIRLLAHAGLIRGWHNKSHPSVSWDECVHPRCAAARDEASEARHE